MKRLWGNDWKLTQLTNTELLMKFFVLRRRISSGPGVSLGPLVVGGGDGKGEFCSEVTQWFRIN